MEIFAGKDIRASNDEIAQENARRFQEANVFVVNLMSSPGAGKTSLLERTLADNKAHVRMAVIEGDLQTSKDAERIAKFQVPVYQINTNGGCHLDARMIYQVLDYFDLHNLDILFIENVGNLVCPASFWLGEHKKAVLLSIPEGSDKPAKYPKIFHCADVVLFNKIDLLGACDFNMDEAVRDLQQIKPGIPIVGLSCRTKEGLEDWYQWLGSQIRARK